MSPLMDTYLRSLEVACEVFGADSESITRSTDSIGELVRYIEKNDVEQCSRYIGRIDGEALKCFTVVLVESALRHLDLSNFLRPLKTGKLFVFCLSALASKSHRFRETVSSTNINCWIQLMRQEPVRTEFFAALRHIAPYLHKSFYFEHAYWKRFLTDLANVGKNVLEYHNTDLTEHVLFAFLNLLIHDSTFIFESHHSMITTAFNNVLHVVSTLFRELEHNKERENIRAEFISKIEPHNVGFCVELLEKIQSDYGDANQFLSNAVCSQIHFLLNIVLYAYQMSPYFDCCTNNDLRIPTVICALTGKLLGSWNDQLTARFVQEGSLGDLFIALMHALQIICRNNSQNKIFAGENVLELLVLSINNELPPTNTRLKEHALNACKSIVSDCPENRQRVDELVQKGHLDELIQSHICGNHPFNCTQADITDDENDPDQNALDGGSSFEDDEEDDQSDICLEEDEQSPPVKSP